MNSTIKAVHYAMLSPDMKLFELVEAAPSLLSIISRLGISLPFGDISIREMCARDGHDVELFLMLCAMHIDQHFRPEPSELRAEMLDDVVGYLRASHRYYADHMLPHTSTHLERILDHCDELSRSVLRRFYDDYTRYIISHFAEEEQCIFALIEGRDKGTVKADCSLFDMPHTDIDDRTNDIASLIFKCLPERASTALRCAMLSDIYALRDDLRRHNDVEMYLLRPMIEKFISSK